MDKKSIIKNWEFRFTAHSMDEIPKVQERRLDAFQQFTSFVADESKTEWIPTVFFRIAGNIEDDNRFNNDTRILTSVVGSIQKEDDKLFAITRNGSRYLLQNMSLGMSLQVEECREFGIVSDHEVEIIFM